MKISLNCETLSLTFVLALDCCWILAISAQLVPQPGLSYWYPNSYFAPDPRDGGGYGYASGGAYPAISTPYQYDYQYQYPAYSYCCYSGGYPQPATTTTTERTRPTRPYSVFARHSLAVQNTRCPHGTELKWNGYSFSQIAYGDKQEGPGADLGCYRSCYRDISTLIPYLQRNYTAYWLNSDHEPAGHEQGNESTELYDSSPYISRCVVCHVKAQVKTVHSFADESPTCPMGWRRLWNGFSYAQGQTDPGTSKEAYERALVSPGSCLEKFRAKPFIKCPGQGHCAPFSSAYGYWIPASGSRHTISKCTVCTTQPIGRPDPYTGAPTTTTTVATTTRRTVKTTTTTRPPSSTTTTTTSTTPSTTITTESIPPSTTTAEPTSSSPPTSSSSTTTTETTTPKTTPTSITTEATSTTTATSPATTSTTTTTESAPSSSRTTTEEGLPDIPDTGETGQGQVAQSNNSQSSQ